MIERAIEIVCSSGNACRIEWYSLGKTNADVKAYLNRENSDERALGVFFTGSLENDSTKNLVFIPFDWVDLSAGDSVQSHLTETRQ